MATSDDTGFGWLLTSADDVLRALQARPNRIVLVVCDTLRRAGAAFEDVFVTAMDSGVTPDRVQRSPGSALLGLCNGSRAWFMAGESVWLQILGVNAHGVWFVPSAEAFDHKTIETAWIRCQRGLEDEERQADGNA